MNYYNEWDAYCAQWLRNLIEAGHLPKGDVDERDIREVEPDDLEGYEQVHLFAGIGGWPLALQLAGWEGPVWTGSCPCQPLSGAGQRKGHADERHLWPAFHALVAECRPATVFGEQVASKLGREWLSGVRADLEDLGYAVGIASLPAAGVGAPHIRERFFWVGNTSSAGLRRNGGAISGEKTQGCGQGIEDGHQLDKSVFASFWDNYAIISSVEQKKRRIEPGTFPLAHGISQRVGKLRAYGNSVVPQVAAEFVRAAM